MSSALAPPTLFDHDVRTVLDFLVGTILTQMSLLTTIEADSTFVFVGTIFGDVPFAMAKVTGHSLGTSLYIVPYVLTSEKETRKIWQNYDYAHEVTSKFHMP